MKFIRVLKSSLPNENSLGELIANNEQTLQNFWNWFNGSKVVDEQGRPLVVYHGTMSDFNEFNTNYVFSTNDIETAKRYGHTLSLYLNIKNPYIINADGDIWSEVQIPKEIKENFSYHIENIQYEIYSDAQFEEDEEYYSNVLPIREIVDIISTNRDIIQCDGIIVNDIKEDEGIVDDYIVFNSNQIKSIKNNNAYKSEDNSIYGSKL